MHRIFTAAFCLLFAWLHAQQGEFLYTVPLNKFVTPEQAQTHWWHEYLEPQVNANLLQPLFDAIEAGKIAVYEPVYPFAKALNKEETHRALHPLVSNYTLDPETQQWSDTPQEESYSASTVISLSFYEDWNYNAQQKTLEKNVRGIIVHVLKIDSPTREGTALFYVPFKKAASNFAPQVENITYNMNVEGAPFNILHGTTQSFTDADKKPMEDSLLLRMSRLPKNIALFQPVFPYEKPVSAKTLPAPAAAKNTVPNICFYESWTIDLGQMCFLKQVHGFVLSPANGSAVFVPLNGYASKQKKLPSAVLIDTISYLSPFVKMPGNDVFSNRQVLLNADTNRLRSVCWVYDSLVQDGAVRAYASDGGGYSRHSLPHASADSLFYTYETVVFEDPDKPGTDREMILSHQVEAEELSGFQFCESWKYDAVRQHFSKSVYATSLLKPKYDYDGQILALMPFVTVHTSGDSTLERPQYLVAAHVTVPVQINFEMESVSPEYSLDSNLCIPNEGGTYCEIIPSQRYALVQGIVNDVLSGKMTAYDTLGNVLAPKKLQAQLDALKNPGWHTELPSDFIALNELLFDESWYFNPATGQLYKKVNAITFAHRAFARNAYAPRQPVFTVRMKS